MSLTALEGFLTAIELLNHGTDHGCEYAIYPLPEAESIGESLNAYFSSQSTSSSPRQPAENWHIRTVALGLSWKEIVGERLKYWFFEEEHSPRVDAWNQGAFVEQALNYLVREIGEPEVQEIFVSPPMWYDCQWQDFVFSTPKGKWILHLGFSD